MEKLYHKIWPAAVILAAALLLVLLGLFRLSQADSVQTALPLSCTESDRNGWTFETADGPAEPVFGFGGYLDGIPADGSGYVAAERVMDEAGERTMLQFSCFDCAIQVFLEGELLYTDFPAAENRADTPLTGVDPTGTYHEGLDVSLPLDCTGKTLRIVTYGTALDGMLQPAFPSMVSRFSDAVTLTASVVWPMAETTALLLLGLFLLLVFLFGAHTGTYPWQLVPLGGYFLLAAVPVVSKSFLASAAGLDTEHGLTAWLSAVSMDLLLCFVALSVQGWKRRGLLIGAAVHILLAATAPERLANWVGFVLFLAAVVLMLFSQEKLLRRTSLCICAAVGVLLAAWCVSRFTAVEYLYPLSNPVTALLSAQDPKALYSLLCFLASLLCTVQAVTAFVSAVFRRQREVLTLQSRTQMAQEKYEQTQETLRQTAAFRHEWKNHMAALQVLTRKQDLGAIHEYLSQLDGQLEQLSPKVYTANLTINTILQHFAAQSKQAGVAFRINAVLPETLPINESDLCSFLFNLLDNALEAAENVQDGEIVCSMQVRQQHLAIRCENSYDGTVRTEDNGALRTTKADAAQHGFGLLKLRSIAEKYGSVLDISYDAERFTVMTALKLPAEKA